MSRIAPQINPAKLDRICEAVRTIVAAHPEAKYSGYRGVCHYTVGVVSENHAALATQGCLIGQALAIVCPELLPALRDLDSDATIGINGFFHDFANDERVLWLREVQNIQDNNETWGYCVAKADAYILNHRDVRAIP